MTNEAGFTLKYTSKSHQVKDFNALNTQITALATEDVSFGQKSIDLHLKSA